MKINEWDIAEANAKQWNVTPGFSTIKNNSEWVNGSPTPFLSPGHSGFKKMNVAILVRGPDREGILWNCGEILAKSKEPVKWELDGFSHKFYGAVTNYTFQENPLGRSRIAGNKVAKLTLELSCYEYGERLDGTAFFESASEKKDIVIKNPGNLYTPCILEIIPKVGVAELVIDGIGRNIETGETLPVTIKKLTLGKKVILDGENGLFTEDGTNKSEDVEIWSLPMLAPGINTITLDNTWMDITVRYRPRYM